MKSKTRLLLAFAMTGFIPYSANAQQEWKMQPNLIQTRWAKQVGPNNALTEYPRPQLERKNWKNLNGLWDYTIVRRGEAYPSSYIGKILVPYPVESALSGVKRTVLPEQEVWYRRTVSIAEIRPGERRLLNFGAVDWKATIYVNGKKACVHEGGYTAFTVDITDLVKLGSNELVVQVWDPTDKGIGPTGKQVLNPSSIYYTPSSGIWQTVWMETVPADYITDLKIVPDVDHSIVNITVASKADANVQLTVAGKTFTGKSNKVIQFPLNQVKLWSPDDPYLYGLTVKLGKDQVKSYFGMRKISVMKDSMGIDRIALNNKLYFNLGVLDQGFWPDGLYTAPTDEALAFDIKASKAMGFNTIRKHIKVEPARWYYYADKLGMLVWQDMVNPNQRLPEGSKQEFEKESKEILEQLKNSPSVTTWVLFNEKWGQFDQERLTKMIKDVDPNRLVNGHSGEYLYVNNELRSPSPNAYVGADMTDVHSYPNPKMPEKQLGKAQVLGEFGGIGVSIQGHLWDDTKAGWGYDGTVNPATMQKQYTAMVDSLVKLRDQGLSGSIYTQPFDVETEQNGLLTYDREIIKLSASVFRDINAKLWPVTANYSKAIIGFHAKTAEVMSANYAQKLAEYKAGRKDQGFLRELALMADAEKDNENGKTIANQYISKLANPITEANVAFMMKFINSVNDPGYQIIFSNLDKVAKMPSAGNAVNMVQEVIFNHEVKPLLTNQLDWNAIDNILAKYPALDGEKIIGLTVIHYLNAASKQEPNANKNLIIAASNYDQRFNSGMYNEWAWQLFLNSADKAELTKALDWAKKGIENADPGSEVNAIDTYANLLHKLGRTNEAIDWEKKALATDPNNTEFQETLKKMEAGKATWPEPVK